MLVRRHVTVTRSPWRHTGGKNGGYGFTAAAAVTDEEKEEEEEEEKEEEEEEEGVDEDGCSAMERWPM